jgi:hypothetical protein
MLTHPTLDLLNELGLHGMAKAMKDLDTQPEAGQLAFVTRAADLLDDL